MFYQVPFCILLVLFVPILWCQELPTNYEYYTRDGISSGLDANNPAFLLNGKNFSIYSGTLHYFRVPRAYWRDRLRKIRGAGLNTVETYIPWNLHEFQNGQYDFGKGGSEMEDFLHLEEFLKIAQDEDLFVILRPGPFICAEFNFGGFPSWLLGITPMGFRTSESNYMKYVSRWFNILLPQLVQYQFQKGGPVIIFQVENEYGNMGGNPDPNKTYLHALAQLYKDNNITELLVTSDGPGSGTYGTDPDVFFLTGNYNSNEEDNLNKLAALQPGRPVMTMEYWPGWYDKLGENHHTISSERVHEIYSTILSFPSSVNIYMFHGGTNFYFLNGANMENDELDNSGFSPVTTSYDYDAPLNESGGYTPKYEVIRQLLSEHITIPTKLPELPVITPPIEYAAIPINSKLKLLDALSKNPTATTFSEKPIPFEQFPINNQSGQSYGYAVYRKQLNLPAGAKLTIEGHVCDTVMVLVNGNLVSPPLLTADDLNGFGAWRLKDSSLTLTNVDLNNATLDLVVEEWGRQNIAAMPVYNQSFKGLWQGEILVDDEALYDWVIISAEFKKLWTNRLQGWETDIEDNLQVPSLFKANLTINEEPRDTFVDMSNWGKGIVIVNGFVIGRYSRIGPQQSLYLPAPFLNQGENVIVIFEHFKADNVITFSNQLKWGNN